MATRLVGRLVAEKDILTAERWATEKAVPRVAVKESMLVYGWAGWMAELLVGTKDPKRVDVLVEKMAEHSVVE